METEQKKLIDETKNLDIRLEQLWQQLELKFKDFFLKSNPLKVTMERAKFSCSFYSKRMREYKIFIRFIEIF